MHFRSKPNAFTLIELSLVVLVLGLLAAAGLRYAASTSEANGYATTNATLNVIEAALLSYRNQYGMLPCPANITVAENSASFGVQVDTLGDGACTGYNFINASDPDAAGGSDNNYSGAADPLYDSATLNKIVGGSVPTKTLKIADKYSYDAWGNKIFYTVDKRATSFGAFTLNSISSISIGGIVVKRNATDTLANAITYQAVYTLVSTGKNGLGSYARNLTGTDARSASIFATNTDEQKNSHWTGSSVYDRIFVQKSKTMSSTGYNSGFDDIVRFKTRSQLASNSELN